jgi:hypothetical protein
MADNNIPGTDEQDAALDAALREYFCSRLDGQLGRTAANFHRHLRSGGAGTGSGPAAGPRRRSPGLGPGGGWVVGVVGGAQAASIAALWAGPSLRFYTPAGPAGSPAGTAMITEAHERPADSRPGAGTGLQVEELTLCSQTSDGGTVLLDERTAARRLIRKELKQTRWLDPRTGASIEKIEPRQDIMLIQLETY